MAGIAFIWSGVSNMAQARTDVIPGSRYVSARGAALGDAFLPLANDPMGGLFYNPAAIGALKPRGDGFNLQFRGSQDYMVNLETTSTRVLNLQSFLENIQAKPNTTQGVGLTFAPAFAYTGIAAGVLIDGETRARYTDGYVRYATVYQIAPALGFGIPIKRGIVRLGYSLQWVNQISGQGMLTETDPNLSYYHGLYSGSGLSHNFGFALTLPIIHLPALNIVFRNIGGLRFGGTSLLGGLVTSSAGAPPTEPMTIDTSFSFVQRFFKHNQMNFVFQLRDLTSQSGFSMLKRAAIGTEISLGGLFFLRGGWSAMYPSVGIGVQTKKAEFSLTWHSDEIGTSTESIRNAKFVFQLQTRVF